SGSQLYYPGKPRHKALSRDVRLKQIRVENSTSFKCSDHRRAEVRTAFQATILPGFGTTPGCAVRTAQELRGFGVANDHAQVRIVNERPPGPDAEGGEH